MRNLFEEFTYLWPPSRQHSLGHLLKNTQVLRLPADLALVGKGQKETTLVVVDPGGKELNPIEYLRQGYEHVLYSARQDFGPELFASCLMSKRPDNFTENPIPYFFHGFSPGPLEENNDHSFIRSFNTSEEKPFLIAELDNFFKSEKALKNIQDICLQAADEMISNAIYNAPVDAFGRHLYQNVARDVDVTLSPGKKIKLFACFNAKKVVIGCEDPFGSLEREIILNRLAEIYAQTQVSPLMSSAGAGMGLKFMIENSANFYMFCERKKRSIVACTFLLEGRKKNINTNNHLHFSIR